MANRPQIVRTVPALRSAVARLRDVAATKSRSCRRWARCTPAISPWSSRPAGERPMSSSRSSSTRRSLRRTKTSPPIRVRLMPMSRRWPETADLVWAPPVDVMYPAGFSSRIVPAGPAIVGLEDRFRPHFFGGVATVVAKLLIQCLPDYAMFGEKDYQQLKVVTQMAKDLDLPVEIVGVPTMREPDGLALSSRNAYLSVNDRATAPVLYQVAQAVRGGDRPGRKPGAGARRRRHGDRNRGVHARLPRSAQRRHFGAGLDVGRCPAPTSGRRPDRQDQAHRQHRSLTRGLAISSQPSPGP